MRIALFILLFVSQSAFATWGHIDKVVTPVVTTPPVVTAPATAPEATAQPATSSGPGVIGWYVMAFWIVFHYLAICQLEEERDPEMFKTLMCPPTPDWTFEEPFTATP